MFIFWTLNIKIKILIENVSPTGQQVPGYCIANLIHNSHK